MKFSDIPIGTKFRDIFAGLWYIKIEPYQFHGKRIACRYCQQPAETLLNARSLTDNSPQHFCPHEKVSVERVEVTG